MDEKMKDDTTPFEEFLEQFKNNKVLWEKQDSKITVLTYWKNPLTCESCGKQTHTTSRTNIEGSPPHPFCEDCYKEFHAYHLAVLTSEKETEP